jgi:hypothetical protein
MTQTYIESTVVFDGYEVLPAPPVPTQETAELIDMLVSRFEQSLLEKEYELAALRSQVEDAQYGREGEIVLLRGRLDEAERFGEEARRELDAVNMVCRMLERENRRLTSEVSELRAALERSTSADNLLAALLTQPI